MLLNLQKGVLYRRNRKDLLKTSEKLRCPDPIVDIQETEKPITPMDISTDIPQTVDQPINIQTEETTIRRSERQKIRPKRLIEEMLTVRAR